MTRRLLLFVLSFTLSLGLFSRHEAAAETTATLTRGPYLQLATPNSIAIVWRVVGNTIPSVRYGRDANQLENEWKQRDGVILRLSPDQPRDPEHPRLHSAPANTMQIEAHLTGLEPNTNTITRFTMETRSCSAMTPATLSRILRRTMLSRCTFWVVGDSGTAVPLRRPCMRPCDRMSKTIPFRWICSCMSVTWRTATARMINSRTISSKCMSNAAPYGVLAGDRES